MKVLAIDPHINKQYAIALFDDHTLVNLGYAELHVVELLVNLADHVYIEDQYFGKNNNTMKKLAQSSGKVIGLCELHDTAYTLVHPATWQSRAGIKLKKKKDMKQSEWVKYKANEYIRAAELIVGDEKLKIENDDFAVAIIMAWAMGVEGDRT